MKSKQKAVQFFLKWSAEKILKKYQPKIIAITGSVGKSTAKEMIFTVLKDNFSVRKSEKNYNNEIGIPLAIIGVSGEKKNIFQWGMVLIKIITLICFRQKYPKLLVLELASDKEGDIKYFCDFIPIDIAVLTNVGVSHLKNFKSKEAIFKEKTYLLQQAKSLVIYNVDGVAEDKIKKISLPLKNLSYGLQNKADFFISEVGYKYNKDNLLAGMIFKLQYKDKELFGQLKNVFGRPYLYGVLVAVSLAKYFQLDISQCLKKMENFSALAGHMFLLRGIKNTTIIDDTYNSAPASLKEALRVIKDVKAKRKIIVLGDMLELGNIEEKSHQKVGRWVSRIKGNIFIAVGERMKRAVMEFKKCQKANSEKIELAQAVHWFANSKEAGYFVQNLLKTGDIVLIKGSQGLRMEKIVKEIMAEPNKAKQLLVRQNKDWQS